MGIAEFIIGRAFARPVASTHAMPSTGFNRAEALLVEQGHGHFANCVMMQLCR
jgi:hypothetical protein